MCLRVVSFMAAMVCLMSAPVLAYVGPGAGVGGTSGMGVGAIVILIIGGLLGLAILCGLIAAVIAAGDRIRTWVGSRNESETADASK